VGDVSTIVETSPCRPRDPFRGGGELRPLPQRIGTPPQVPGMYQRASALPAILPGGAWPQAGRA
jgi:hypothetical protein